MLDVCAGYPLVDEVMDRFAGSLGRDRTAYRNHVTRVLNFFTALAGGGGPPRQVVIAAAFHDLGIWTAGTFDYLAPSVALARDHLAATGLDALAAEVEAIIVSHHKLTPYRGEHAGTVEVFRRADLADVSLGAIRSGLPARFVRAVRSALPNAGFHRRLLDLTVRQMLRSPLHPLPMVRW
jgi:hypothetical protein